MRTLKGKLLPVKSLYFRNMIFVHKEGESISLSAVLIGLTETFYVMTHFCRLLNLGNYLPLVATGTDHFDIYHFDSYMEIEHVLFFYSDQRQCQEAVS